jgi:uncharacterized protein (DUF2267 family)
MEATVESVFASTLNKSREWLDDLAHLIGTDDAREAYRVLRATLQLLRDLSGPEVAAHVSAQLPLLLRGTFYEGWDPTRHAHWTEQDVIDRLEDEILLAAEEALDVARAAIQVMTDHLGEGTMHHITAVVTAEVAQLLRLPRVV